MKTKKTILFFFACALFIQLQGQTKFESGLILNGSKGSMQADLAASIKEKYSENTVDYKSGFSIGYRFRVPAFLYPMFLDLDANVGIKSWHSSYGMTKGEPPVYEASSKFYFVSAGGTVNYSVYKGLSVGAGVEPTYFLYQDGENNTKSFDLPLVGKVAYNFKAFELGVSYKHGLMNVAKTDYLDSGKLREFVLSIWIPF